MFENHELVKTVLRAVEDGSSLSERAEAVAQALQSFSAHDVVKTLVQKLSAQFPGIAGVVADLGADDVAKTLRSAVVTGSTVDQRAAGLLAALKTDHDAAWVLDFVRSELNPVRTPPAALETEAAATAQSESEV